MALIRYEIFVLGTWHRIDWVGKYQGLYTGMKFCSICEYTSPLVFIPMIFHPNVCSHGDSFFVMLCLFLQLKEGCEETTWLGHFLPICVSSLVCGTCKLLFFLLVPLCSSFVFFMLGPHLKCFIFFMTTCSDVRNNSLIGSIPQNIGNCTAFQVLYVYHRNQQHQIMDNFTLFYCNDSNSLLICRDLSYNQLTGEIPFNIGFLQVATLYVTRKSFWLA